MTPATSSAFARLDERVQRWIWEQGWNELRDAQEQAIPPILAGDQDVIIAAATAAGKTEAAFLPIASALCAAETPGLALYLSPLKALINDQFLRLGDLFGSLDLPVYPWHGDVHTGPKRNFEKHSHGALLITPESLESLFVRKGFYLAHMFRHLRYIVVDELHSFIGRERGMQVSSLLHRLEDCLGRRVPRIGLSATLGDLQLAAEYLRPGQAQRVRIVESKLGPLELRILVKGYRDGWDGDGEEGEFLSIDRVAANVFAAMRGTKNLVFANSRTMVEQFTDRVARIYERHQLPNEFHAHHGSLAKELREDVESILKDPERPATAVCTSTLEMGIDIGTVRSVAQLSPPFSVASLRQRLGRSGRRGEPAILRAFVTETGAPSASLQDRLRLDLTQTIACIELLLQRWCEPPLSGAMHLSTLMHQLLSVIAQRGGISAKEAYTLLCKAGPFSLDVPRFTELLRDLAARGFLVQSEDGTLLHGPSAEPMVNHYSFYPTFVSQEEYRLLHGARMLGKLSVNQPVAEKALILFGGRRWRVTRVDPEARVIEVAPAKGGRAPSFMGGSPGNVHPKVHQEMLAWYLRDACPAYLDAEAKSLLEEGRALFQRHDLANARIIAVPEGTLLFLWAGDRVSNTIAVQCQSLGHSAASFGVGVMIEGIEPDRLYAEAREWLEIGPPAGPVLAQAVANKAVEKYDQYLPATLLAEGYAAAYLAPEEAWTALAEALGGR
ncbi:MAG: DEAD/DEAH box helicase [Bryobacteraceae bacterium]|nr:DEAD/DEAH box helicase [Bryobacteraceae bacterium]